MTKTILVTGATAGFGEAAARRFAAEGWRVIGTGRRGERHAAQQVGRDHPVEIGDAGEEGERVGAGCRRQVAPLALDIAVAGETRADGGKMGAVDQHHPGKGAGQRFERQLARAVHPRGDLAVEAAPSQVAQHGGEVGLGHGTAFAAVPQRAHDGVQRGAALGAQREVEAQRHQRASHPRESLHVPPDAINDRQPARRS